MPGRVPLYKRFPLLLNMAPCAFAGSTNIKHCANKEKAKDGKGRVPLTNVGYSTSPNGTELCRPMPVIYGDFPEPAPKTGNTFVDKHTASKLRQVKCANTIFFHEYGRRVGMVSRSSLKGGKNSLMVEKRTRTPNTTQTKQPKAHRPSLHHHVVFSLCWVKRVKRKRVTGNGPEFTNEKHIGAGLCSSKVTKKGFKGTLLHDCK